MRTLRPTAQLWEDVEGTKDDLQALTDKRDRAIRLLYDRGYSYREIAARAGIAHDTVRRIVLAGRK